MLLPLSLLSNMFIPISPGTSLDTIFVLPMDGQGLPSPNIYKCVDLLIISGSPPSLTNAFLPIQDRCAPVSIMHFKTLGHPLSPFRGQKSRLFVAFFIHIPIETECIEMENIDFKKWSGWTSSTLVFKIIFLI